MRSTVVLHARFEYRRRLQTIQPSGKKQLGVVYEEKNCKILHKTKCANNAAVTNKISDKKLRVKSTKQRNMFG